jgi:hypothetical protein
MADGISSTVGDALLASILNDTAFTAYGPVYVQLHVGAPGAAGTANIAGETTRESAGTFATPSGGSTTNSAAINWTSVSTSETYTNITLWSAATSGTFVASGTITASAVTVGDNFSIPIGDATVSVTVAA